MLPLLCMLALGLAARAAEPAPAPRDTVSVPWGELPRPDAEPPEPGPGSPVGGGDVQPVPYLMAALGDSITAALFAGTSLGDAQVGITLEEVEASHRGARLFERKDTLSWASGREIDSYYMRLKAVIEREPGRGLAVRNYAATGNRAADLVAQASAAAADAASGEFLGVKLVTLLIGANDACAGGLEGTPNESMRASLLAAFAILAGIRQEEPVRVLVSAMPNVPSVAKPEIRDRTFLGSVTCGELWRKTGICDGMLVWSTEAEYRARAAAVAAKNALLRRTAEEARALFPSLSVAFSDRFSAQEYRAADMAFDCFHPNRASQERIAAELWRDQPWFK